MKILFLTIYMVNAFMSVLYDVDEKFADYFNIKVWMRL